ncbi:MAG: hypothetical protein JSR32_01385 [Proteobacteria bacterium]|nr:hypothetical protein [Pseudomonadota bacterium]
MRIVLFLLLLALPLAIQADTGIQVRQLEKSLARIQQESQSIQQQFMMIQELRRNEISESPTLIPSIPSAKSVPVPKYEDLIRLQQEKQERIEKYTADLNRLYARYNELENEKQTILEQIKSLEQKTEE